MFKFVIFADKKTISGSLEETINNTYLPLSVRKLTININEKIKILDDMKRFKEHKKAMDTIINVEDIKFKFIKLYRYRRGTVLLALQKSILGVRKIWYLTETKHHNGECFGTRPNIELVKKLNNELEKNLINENISKLL